MRAPSAFDLRFLGFLGLLLCCASAQAQGKASGTGSYPVQAGDVLQVSVWKEPDLQMEVLVRPDGGFSFPLAGELAAQGKSVATLRKELTKRLARYLPDPVVTVSVKQVLGNKIYILGQVENPGEFVTNRPVDVMQALSMAGGTTAYAALNEIKILRREDGDQISIPFRYKDVVQGQKLDQNIVLRSGDIVVVP